MTIPITLGVASVLLRIKFPSASNIIVPNGGHLICGFSTALNANYEAASCIE